MQLTHSRHHQMDTNTTGFTLLEVLIALTLLSLGLMGMAALQTQSLKFSNIALYRSVATQRVLDITDRVRANKDATDNTKCPNCANSYQFFASSYEAATLTARTITEQEATQCNQKSCTPSEIAIADIAQWNRQNTQLLPGGMGMVQGDRLNGYEVVIAWQENEMKGKQDPTCQAIPNFSAPEGVRCFRSRFMP
jgi:type IV pilus assembly protein PilV